MKFSRLAIFWNSPRRLGGEQKAILEQAEVFWEERIFDRVIPVEIPSSECMTSFSSAVFQAASFSHAEEKLDRVVSQRNVDLILAHNVMPFAGKAPFRVARRYGIPLVMFVHSFKLWSVDGYLVDQRRVARKALGGDLAQTLCSLYDSPKSSTERAVLDFHRSRVEKLVPQVRAFIVPSLSAGEYLERLGVRSRRIFVLPHFLHMKDRPATSSGNKIGFLGRLAPEKGVEILLEAARRCPEYQFTIGGSGESTRKLKSSAPSNVRFIGKVLPDQMSDFYRSLRCLVIPSLWPETFGYVAAEALQYGCPVIASDIGALPETVVPPKHGWVFQPGNVDELVACLYEAMLDPEATAERGLKGRRFVQSHYLRSDWLRRFRSIIEEV